MGEVILLLDGQAVQTLAVAEDLHRNGYHVIAICNGKNNYGYHSKYVDERYVGPSSHVIDTYYLFLRSFLENHKVDAIIPMNDDSAECISKYKNEIIKISHVIMPDYDDFLNGYDKCRLMKLCKQKGFPHPVTFDMDDVLKSDFKILTEISFPVLLKPNQTTGGRGMIRVDSINVLKKTYPKIKEKYGDCHLQQYIPEGGRQVKVEIFMNKHHEVIHSSVINKQRYYPVHGGSSCCCSSEDNPSLIEMCSSVLKEIRWIGFADFDMIENPDTGMFLIMEINPRIPACIRVVNKSGIDFATIIADETLGKVQRHYEYRPGKTLRHLGFEILWFLKSTHRFHANPSWFKFLGYNIYYQDLIWNELPAFIYGSWGNINKLMSSDFRREKFGF